MKGMRNIAPFGLRMPDELRDIIQQRAKDNGRSMNSEIVQILQDATSGSKVGAVRLSAGEPDYLEIDLSNSKSVIDALVKLTCTLQEQSNKEYSKKKPD